MTDKGQEWAEDFLAHYASPYYDPVKAKEYYERTKELKGRQSTKGMSDTQRQALSYTKKSIGEAKKAEVKKAAEAQKERLEMIRETADATRDRLKDKLQGLLDAIKAKADKVAEIEPPKPKLIPLNPIPPNASPKLRAYLEKQNAAITQTNKKATDKANADFARKKQAAQAAAATSSAAARKAMSEQIKRVGIDAKASIDKARKSYEAGRKATEAKYKQASDTEYNNIRTQLPSAPPKVKKPRKRRSTKKEGETSSESQA